MKVVRMAEKSPAKRRRTSKFRCQASILRLSYWLASLAYRGQNVPSASASRSPASMLAKVNKASVALAMPLFNVGLCEGFSDSSACECGREFTEKGHLGGGSLVEEGKPVGTRVDYKG